MATSSKSKTKSGERPDHRLSSTLLTSQEGKGEAKTVKLEISNSLSLPLLEVAVSAILNSSTKVVEGECDKVKVIFNQELLQAYQALLGSREYTFVLSRTATLTSGTGSFKINSSTDLTQYSEGAALIALFNECKMIEGQMQMVTAPLSGLTLFGCIFGFYPAIDTTTPSLAQVQRLEYVNMYSFGNHGPIMGSSTSQALHWKCPKRNWGFTVDEGVSAPRIVSGCNGTIKWCDMVGTPSNSSAYAAYLTKVKVKLRTRT